MQFEKYIMTARGVSFSVAAQALWDVMLYD
jgi:hypothetical protein